HRKVKFDRGVPVQKLFGDHTAEKSDLGNRSSAGNTNAAEIAEHLDSGKLFGSRPPFLAGDVDTGLSKAGLGLADLSGKYGGGVLSPPKRGDLLALIAGDIDHVQIGTVQPRVCRETIDKHLISRRRFL